MDAITSAITSITIVYSTVYSDADQRKHQSSASLAFVWGIHRGLVNSPHKWPVTRKMFPFDDVIMIQATCFKKHSLIFASPIGIWYQHPCVSGKTSWKMLCFNFQKPRFLPRQALEKVNYKHPVVMLVHGNIAWYDVIRQLIENP